MYFVTVVITIQSGCEYQQIAVGQPNCMYQCRGGISQIVFPVLHDLCKIAN